MSGEWLAALAVGLFAALAVAAGIRTTRRVNRAWLGVAAARGLGYQPASDGGPRLTGEVHGLGVRIDVLTLEQRGRRELWTRVRVDAGLPPDVMILRDGDAPGGDAALKMSGAGAQLVATTSPSLRAWLDDTGAGRDVRVSGGALEEYLAGIVDEADELARVVDELVVRARLLVAARGRRADAAHALAVATDPSAPADVRAEALHIAAIWAPSGWTDVLDAMTDDPADLVRAAAREIRAAIGTG